MRVSFRIYAGQEHFAPDCFAGRINKAVAVRIGGRLIPATLAKAIVSKSGQSAEITVDIGDTISLGGMGR